MRELVFAAAIAIVGGSFGCSSSDTGPAAIPTFFPPPGTYTTSQSVTLSCMTPGATIYYTTDGSGPTRSSPVYVAPIVVSSTRTIKAIATADGFTSSDVATGVYTIAPPAQTATPTFAPPPGTYDSPQSVTISCTTPGATILYTTDGSLPDIYSSVYSGPLTVSSTTTIRAFAWPSSGTDASHVATATYTIAQSGACTAGTTQVCFTGPSWARGVGACHDGLQTCAGGQWSACVGEQLPLAETCNSVDDDCDGLRDDGPFGVRDGNPPCAGALVANAPLAGDTGAQSTVRWGYGEQWFSQTFTETHGAARDLTGTIALYSPFGCDFDLYVHCDACGASLVGSSAVRYGTDAVYVRASDDETADDTFTVMIEVRYVTCAPGMNPGEEVCGDWTLNIYGNTEAPAGALLCN
jgi:hypothetical protein